jgi:methylated-DNA-[protein]-cysteine S-methyltransferase
VIRLDVVDSPIGPLTIAERGATVCLLHFGRVLKPARQSLQRWYPGVPIVDAECAATRGILTRYFAKELTALDGVPVELNGTPFQKQVWTALRSIAAGTTTSYSELARRIGHRDAVRAVGAANGANPVALIVPCHRVIGANGSLTGYGGGLSRKRWLLDHESPAIGLFGNQTMQT